MRKQWFGGIVGLGALLIVTGGAYPAAGEINNSSGGEGPAMEATGSPSFGTEDWTGPTEQAPIVVVKSPSLGTEDWTGSMESSEALGAGAIPETPCEDVSPDDYSPEC